MRRGTRVGQAYVSVTADGSGINEEIVSSVDAAGDDIDKKGDEHGERYGDHFSEGFFTRMRNKFNKRFDSDLGDGLDRSGTNAGNRVGDNMGNALVKRLRARLSVADDLVERLGLDFDKALANKNTSFKELDTLSRKIRAAEGFASSLRRELVKVESAVSGNGMRRRNTGLTALDDWLLKSRFRNNFINILAKSFGGLIHGLEKGAIVARDFVDNIKNAEEGATMFQKISAGFGGAGAEGAGLFSKLAASGPGAVVAIAAIAAGASILVSVISALLAVIVALVATITSALVGALTVGAAAFGALTAAVGLTVLAFKSMTDAQKKVLSSAFKPLRAEAVGLGQIMLKDLVPAFSSWSKNLQVALSHAEPLARVMGGAFADAGNILTKSLSGPGIQQFLAALSRDLPAIVKNMSRALGGFLNGVGSLFAAIMPDVRQFSRWLSQIATDFAKWAATPKGQNSIKDFIDRALDSLHSFNAFIGATSGLLAKLLFSTQSQQAGNTIFDDMTQGIRNFTAFLTPERLQSWFDQGVSLAKGLGDAIKAIGITAAALNDAGIISGIQSIAKAVGDAAEAFRKLPRPMREALKPFNAIESAAKVMAATVAAAIALIVSDFAALLRVAAKVVSALTKIPGIGDKFKGVAKAVTNAADNVQGFSDRLNKMPRNILLSIEANTDPAVTALNRLISQVKSLHINIPVTASTNATVGEAAALSSGSPTSSGSSASGNVTGLISSGNTAIANSGGSKGPKKFHNPWRKWALSLIKEGPSISAQIKNAILSINKQVAAGLLSAARSIDSGDVQASLQSLSESIKTSATETVNSARDALNSAAENLANATSRKAAKKALREVKAAQKDLAAALANQKRIEAAAKILNAQRIVSQPRVANLLKGILDTNATLADYAEARARVADMLNDANQKLADAISLRDSFSKSVSDSIKTFGSLLSAQAQTIDGVQQALNANDVVSSLQDKLGQIKKFQDDLRILLAQGLSNEAYQQIVEAGVEQGTAIADALIAGGTGAIQNVNSLVGQISGIADSLGTETANRLYQAGVDAAQGLVDGLTSLSAQLDAAAVRLGNTIAAAVARALGIASPSRVMRDMMDYVGDGAVQGLDRQHGKVGSAASRLAAQVAIAPGGPKPGSSADYPAVSGNGKDPRFRDLVVHTPTEDPKAVAFEVLNEVTGRL
jgi:hypothetical protein